MKILLASPRGFCAGVNMAIETLDLAIEAFGTPIYVYHEIVHNKHVVGMFRSRGVVFVDDLGDVPPGSHVLFSAHGVSPEVRRSAAGRRLHSVNATCPLVTKVHQEARRFAEQGYSIVLIGHAGHDEVVGTMGEVPASISLVETPEDVDRLDPPPGARLAYLTQTTLSLDDAHRIIDRLRARFPDIIGPRKDDVCYATENRQAAVRRFAHEADLVLVLGSQNSSNSRRLKELAAACGVKARLIDGAADIDPAWFADSDTVLITAGASAPEQVVEECVAYLRERFDATVEMRSVCRENVRFPLPKELWTFDENP